MASVLDYSRAPQATISSAERLDSIHDPYLDAFGTQFHSSEYDETMAEFDAEPQHLEQRPLNGRLADCFWELFGLVQFDPKLYVWWCTQTFTHGESSLYDI